MPDAQVESGSVADDNATNCQDLQWTTASSSTSAVTLPHPVASVQATISLASQLAEEATAMRLRYGYASRSPSKDGGIFSDQSAVHQYTLAPTSHPHRYDTNRLDTTTSWPPTSNPFQDAGFDLGDRSNTTQMRMLHDAGHGPYIAPRYDNDSQERLVPAPLFDNIMKAPLEAPQLPTNSANIACPARHDIITSARAWVPIMILIASMYATNMALAGIIVAHREQQFNIGYPGAMSYAVATSICTALAKTVELSLVTVVIALIGQILSRRARGLSCRTYGISIAEMSMRTWIMQPGTMFYHAATVRYAGGTLLGLLAIWTTITATLYTTAAEALIYPKLRMGWPESVEFSGLVKTSFGNNVFLSQECKLPDIKRNDSALQNACLQVTYAGQSFHNLQAYLDRWLPPVIEDEQDDEGLSEESTLEARIPPAALMDDDISTTVRGQWIDGRMEDVMSTSQQQNRVIQMATMVLPHMGVAAAAKPNAGNLLRSTRGTEGGIDLFAAVPAPSLEILCAGLNRTELAPFLVADEPKVAIQELSDLFNFGDSPQHQGLPTFKKAPNASNTIVSHHQNVSTDTAAAYLLAAVPTGYNGTDQYMLCSVLARQQLTCTTRYRIVRAGARLSVHCNTDALNKLPYLTDADKTSERTPPIPDFQIIATEFLHATALNNGVDDANASSAYLLTQMLPPSTPAGPTFLPENAPSIAEALAVLAAPPLLMSSMYAPFKPYFDYNATDNILSNPTLEHFSALVAVEAYRSGPSKAWQKSFYLVLWSACALSGFSAMYLFWLYCVGQHGDIVDFTEPQNAFSMAINSPPSMVLNGACGGGPESVQWRAKWMVQASRSENCEGVNEEGTRPHYAWASVGARGSIS